MQQPAKSHIDFIFQRQKIDESKKDEKCQKKNNKKKTRKIKVLKG